jgi:hypothetical protein
VDFADDPRWDNMRAVQIRLLPFDATRLAEVGRKVRDLYPARDPDALLARVGDNFIAALAADVTRGLGGKVGVAPRIFLKKLVAGVLDRVNDFDDFDPVAHFKLNLSPAELTPEECEAAGVVRSVDDIELALAPREGDAPGDS